VQKRYARSKITGVAGLACGGCRPLALSTATTTVIRAHSLHLNIEPQLHITARRVRQGGEVGAERDVQLSLTLAKRGPSRLILQLLLVEASY
jgi:hypothetical protein